MRDVDLFGVEVDHNPHGSGLSGTWEYPPFSVLSARDGWWQERKRQWLALGIQSELGRGENLSAMGGGQFNDARQSNAGGLTWGNPPQVTEKGLNYYRNRAHD